MAKGERPDVPRDEDLTEQRRSSRRRFHLGGRRGHDGPADQRPAPTQLPLRKVTDAQGAEVREVRVRIVETPDGEILMAVDTVMAIYRLTVEKVVSGPEAHRIHEKFELELLRAVARALQSEVARV